jgi:hypothetical protein
MGECSSCLYLNQSVNLLVTWFGCVLARILSYTLSDAYQHAFGRVWGISVPAGIHLATQIRFRESGGWRGTGRWGSALQHVLIFHSPQSQHFNEITGKTDRMRACTHTLLHYSRCVPARPWLCLVHMRASTHSFGNPDKPPRECGWRGMGR